MACYRVNFTFTSSERAKQSLHCDTINFGSDILFTKNYAVMNRSSEPRLWICMSREGEFDFEAKRA